MSTVKKKTSKPHKEASTLHKKAAAFAAILKKEYQGKLIFKPPGPMIKIAKGWVLDAEGRGKRVTVTIYFDAKDVGIFQSVEVKRRKDEFPQLYKDDVWKLTEEGAIARGEMIKYGDPQWRHILDAELACPVFWDSRRLKSPSPGSPKIVDGAQSQIIYAVHAMPPGLGFDLPGFWRS